MNAAPRPTAAELVDRAIALRPRLREGQNAAEENGRHSPELHQAFVDAGFYKILVPERFGGYGYGLEEFFRVGIEIARGDPGVGWNYTLGAGHTFHFCSYFPEKVQEEILGGGSLFISPMRHSPPRPTQKVEGGYRVSATWDYCSGSSYSTHAILGVAIDDGAGGTLSAIAVVPREQFEILPDWGGDLTLGMRASGSNSLRLEDVFIADEYVVPHIYREPDLEPGEPGTLGYQLHGDTLFLGRTLAYFMAELVSTQIGCAFAAMDEYEELVLSRNASFPPRGPRTETTEYHRWFYDIKSKAQTAESILHDALARHRDLGTRWRDENRPIRSVDDVEIRGRIQEAAKLALEAVDIAFATAGTSSVAKGSRMQKYYRDAAMYRTHIAAQFDVIAGTAGAHYFGKPLVF